MLDSIRYRSKNTLEEKIQKLIADGVDQLHVISDFDRTLTMSHTTSSRLLMTCGKMPPEFSVDQQYLYDLYRPIEEDTSIDFEFRSSKIQEWFQLAQASIIRHGVSKDILQYIEYHHKLSLRSGVKEFMKSLYEHQIPLCVFSGGIGNIIEPYFRHNGGVYSNVHLIAKYIEFDESGRGISFTHEHLHSMNKNESLIRDSPYFDQIQKRKNVILLGDLREDARMTEGLEHDCEFKIGFTNDTQLLDVYDVLITNEGNLDFVNDILTRIIDV